MSKKILYVFVALMLVTGITAFPTLGAEKYKIAVLPFDDGSIKGNERWWREDWDLGAGVSDEFVTALMDTQKFRLIEREQIDKVLQEQDFGAAGRVDSRSAAKIGKILGVQFLVMGRVTEFTNKSQSGAVGLGKKGVGLGVKTSTARVTIDARLVNTTTAEIIASVTGKGEKKQTNMGLVVNWNAIAMGSDEFKKTNIGLALRKAVVSASQQLAEKAYGEGAPGGTSGAMIGTVAYASGTKVIINIGSGEGVKPGMVFIVNHIIEEVKDPDTGEVIDEVSEPVAEITVSEVKEKTSTCVVSTKLNTKYEIKVKDKVKQK